MMLVEMIEEWITSTYSLSAHVQIIPTESRDIVKMLRIEIEKGPTFKIKYILPVSQYGVRQVNKINPLFKHQFNDGLLLWKLENILPESLE